MTAASVGISRDRMSAIVQAHGVERRYHGTVPVNLVRAQELEATGLGLTEVAEQIGVGRTTLVKARRASSGLERPRSGNPATPLCDDGA